MGPSEPCKGLGNWSFLKNSLLFVTCTCTVHSPVLSMVHVALWPMAARRSLTLSCPPGDAHSLAWDHTTMQSWQPNACGSKGLYFQMEQELWTLVFLSWPCWGLFPWLQEEMGFEMGVCHSPISCSTWIKALSFCTSTCLMSSAFVAIGNQTSIFVQLH